MKTRIAIILALLGSLGAVSACTHYSAEQRADWVTSKISSELDLNADQKAKLVAVKTTILETRKAHRAEETKQLGEIKQMILSDHLNPAQAKSLIAQRQKFMDQNFDQVFGKVSEFHASLTPEQKKKAVDLLDRFASHWQ